MRGVFVTGTGTEVGKTVVASVFARGLVRAGHTVAVFKPAVSGLADAAPGGGDHELLRRAASSAQTDDEIAPYRYREPVSPHLAAELAGEEIDPHLLTARAREAAAGADRFVCEGVGGLMVPLRPGYLVRDFAVELALPLVIASPPGLGAINHALLTIEAARAAGLAVAALVLTPWPEHPERIHLSNRETIAALGEVTVEVLPPIDPADPSNWPSLSSTFSRSKIRSAPVVPNCWDFPGSEPTGRDTRPG